MKVKSSRGGEVTVLGAIVGVFGLATAMVLRSYDPVVIAAVVMGTSVAAAKLVGCVMLVRRRTRRKARKSVTS